jgi:16S rRNA (guanine527-N7)-methyltransferase
VSRAAQRALEEALQRHAVSAGAREPLLALIELLERQEAPTSVHDPAQVVDVHVADSLAGLEIPEVQSARLVADLGAGAGLPGLVLAAALPAARVALVEATKRKCEFIRRAIDSMGLTNAEVVCSRVEKWEDGVGRCDVVSARALAALPVLCEYAAPLLRIGGVLVAWKGAVSDTEAADAAAAAAHLGLAAEPTRSVAPFTGSERRTLHVLRKIGPTPPTYPRRAGVASKRPLSARNLR